jgi:hypothetical protein
MCHYLHFDPYSYNAGMAWRYLPTLCKRTWLCNFWCDSKIRHVSACQSEFKGEPPIHWCNLLPFDNLYHVVQSVYFFWLCFAAIQDGGCKYGAMGRKVQFYDACQVFSQLEVLPVRLPRELLHGTLSVTKANAMFVGEVGPGSPILLQLQIAGCDLSFTW